MLITRHTIPFVLGYLQQGIQPFVLQDAHNKTCDAIRSEMIIGHDTAMDLYTILQGRNGATYTFVVRCCEFETIGRWCEFETVDRYKFRYGMTNRIIMLLSCSHYLNIRFSSQLPCDVYFPYGQYVMINMIPSSD